MFSRNMIHVIFVILLFVLHLKRRSMDDNTQDKWYR